jgi:hypothetical protein
MRRSETADSRLHVARLRLSNVLRQRLRLEVWGAFHHQSTTQDPPDVEVGTPLDTLRELDAAARLLAGEGDDSPLAEVGRSWLEIPDKIRHSLALTQNAAAAPLWGW